MSWFNVRNKIHTKYLSSDLFMCIFQSYQLKKEDTFKCQLRYTSAVDWRFVLQNLGTLQDGHTIKKIIGVKNRSSIHGIHCGDGQTRRVSFYLLPVQRPTQKLERDQLGRTGKDLDSRTQQEFRGASHAVWGGHQ